jgi:ADP-ribose pyrophosphatase YjhB (NUDIX family)
MEERESVEEGAAREAMEEATADIEVGPLLGVWSVPRISQVHMMFVARLRRPEVAAGEESLEVRLFDWSEIPWEELAFPSVVAALRRFEEVRGRNIFEAAVGPLGER